MQGRRVYPDPNDPDGRPLPLLKPGEYGRTADGDWYCCAPRDTGAFFTNFHGSLGDGVRSHKIIEHENGTITVSPSILITRHDGTWHGFLEKGVWREC